MPSPGWLLLVLSDSPVAVVLAVVLLILVVWMLWLRQRSPVLRVVSTYPPPPDSHLQWTPIPSPEARAESDRELLSWLLANGVYFHPSVEIGYFANSSYIDPSTGGPLAVRGITTIAAIPAGTTLVTVPGHLVIDESSLQHSVLSPLLEQLKPPQLVQAALQLMLARAEGESGRWAQLVAALPCIPPGLPFWEDKPAWLAGSRVVQLEARLVAHREQLWQKHVQCAGKQLCGVLDAKQASLEAFCWACGILNSRQHPGGLVPVIDLFNHRVGAGTVEASVVTRSKTRAAVSLCDSPTGVQLYVDYGDRSNEELLLYFGFATECNPYDACELPKQVIMQKAQQLFGSCQFPQQLIDLMHADNPAAFERSHSLRLFADFVEPISIAVLRAVAGAKDGIDSEAMRQRLRDGKPLSDKNEVHAWCCWVGQVCVLGQLDTMHLLREICCELMPAMPSSLGEAAPAQHRCVDAWLYGV